MKPHSSLMEKMMDPLRKRQVNAGASRNWIILNLLVRMVCTREDSVLSFVLLYLMILRSGKLASDASAICRASLT
jgi:hypothetical protein